MDEQKRIILLRKYGTGVLDDFYDVLFVSGRLDGGLVVETSLEGDVSDCGEDVNCYGEMIVEKSEKVFNAEQLFTAIGSVTDDQYCRWENIDWSWDEVVVNLKPHYPSLSNDLAQVINKNVPKRPNK